MTRRPPSRVERDRAISTVLDVAAFLLLVSAAVGLLYAAPQAEDGATDPDVAAETATTLATSIETVEYAPAPDGDAEDAAASRPDRGTIAELLAETTVANARLDGTPVTRAPNHESAVRNATRRTISPTGSDVRIQVRTSWRPLPDSGVRGGIVVGPSPPDDADVHAATTAVPVGTTVSPGVGGHDRRSGSERLRGASLLETARSEGCRGLGARLADRVVGTAFPPGPTKQALQAGGDPTELIETRYATAASAVGEDPEAFHGEMGPGQRNERLSEALGERFETTCSGYDSPEAAAERASPGVVTVSVRTWSP